MATPSEITLALFTIRQYLGAERYKLIQRHNCDRVLKSEWESQLMKELMLDSLFSLYVTDARGERPYASFRIQVGPNSAGAAVTLTISVDGTQIVSLPIESYFGPGFAISLAAALHGALRQISKEYQCFSDEDGRIWIMAPATETGKDMMFALSISDVSIAEIIDSKSLNGGALPGTMVTSGCCDSMKECFVQDVLDYFSGLIASDCDSVVFLSDEIITGEACCMNIEQDEPGEPGQDTNLYFDPAYFDPAYFN